jgi:hypothetical protein
MPGRGGSAGAPSRSTGSFAGRPGSPSGAAAEPVPHAGHGAATRPHAGRRARRGASGAALVSDRSTVLSLPRRGACQPEGALACRALARRNVDPGQWESALPS